MSARPLVLRIAPTLRRSVVHHARPPRMPALNSPHVPTQPRPTMGTKTPHPPHLGATESNTASSSLDGSLTFHHSPPPTAPSYTTGVVPDLLRWTHGQQVHLTGEEVAPLRRARRSDAEGSLQQLWKEDLVAKMRDLRAQGRSRKEIGDALDIPAEQRHLISRVAPLSAENVKAKEEAAERKEARWGDRKRLSRAIRERRKEFW